MSSEIRIIFIWCYILMMSNGCLLATVSNPSTALKSKDYSSLAHIYQDEIYKSSAPTSTMYYNLGVAHMLMGQRAEAIKHYEMALYLEPTHTEARDNLSLIYKQASNTPGDGRTLLAKFFDPLFYILSIGMWATVALLIFTLSLSCFTFFLLSKHPKHRRYSFYSAAILLFFSLLANAAILHQRHYRNTLEHSLTLRDVTSMFAASESESKIIATLPALTALPLITEKGSWLEVKLRDGRQAWVRKSDVLLPLMLSTP